MRSAAICAWLSIPALLLAAVFITLFFGGAGYIFGPLNDAMVVLTALLLIAPARQLVKALGAPPARWFAVLTWIAMGGLALIALGQTLLIVHVISLSDSFVTGCLGILPVLVWLGAQAYLALRSRTALLMSGRLALAVLVVAALLTAVSATRMTAVVTALSVALVAVLFAYLYVLGRDLWRPAPAS